MTAEGSLEGILGGVVRDALRDLVRSEIRAALTGPAIEASVRNAGDGYLPVTKAAQLAAVAPGTIRAWIRTGRLSAKRAGRVLRVSREELERFMSHGSTVSVAETKRRAAQILSRTPRPSLHGAAA